MMQIGAAEFPACRTATCLVQLRLILGVTGIPEIERARSRKGLPVSTRSGWKNTIEHVDPAKHGTGDVVRFADAHQVAWTGHRKVRNRRIEDIEHCRLAFADGKPAHGIAVEPDLAERIDGAAAQRRIDPSLHDAETGAPRLFTKSGLGTCGPTRGKL